MVYNGPQSKGKAPGEFGDWTRSLDQKEGTQMAVTTSLPERLPEVLYAEGIERSAIRKSYDGEGSFVVAWRDEDGHHYGQYSTSGSTLMERHVPSLEALRLILKAENSGRDVLSSGAA